MRGARLEYEEAREKAGPRIASSFQESIRGGQDIGKGGERRGRKGRKGARIQGMY